MDVPVQESTEKIVEFAITQLGLTICLKTFEKKMKNNI